MTEPRAGAGHEVAEAIRRHRIYYELQRETAQYGERRIVVAVQLWIWATLVRGAGVLPGSPGCRAAVAALQTVAAAALSRSPTRPAPDVEPFRWAPYASRQVPDADEVRLELNFRAPPGVDGPEQARRERSLAEVRRALEELGVSLGLYRGGPAPAPEAPAAPEPWAARSAGEALAPRRPPARPAPPPLAVPSAVHP